jgi:tripartite motif-containing protein 2/3
MASAGAIKSDVKKQLSSVTECPICTDIYRDPRSLPCIHTFCFKCVERFCQDKKSGDNVACPLCKTEFAIPDKGVGGLPRNFFIEQLKEIAFATEYLCGGCCYVAEAGLGPMERAKQAVKYCIECQLGFCEDCLDNHSAMRSTLRHEVVEIRETEGTPVIVEKRTANFCDKHSNEALILYCLDCQVAICFACFGNLHNRHRCSEIGKVVSEFRDQMTQDIEGTLETIARCRDILNAQQEDKVEFCCIVDGVENEINKCADFLKNVIDAERSKLLEDLRVLKTERLKQIQHVIEDIEQHASFADSFVKYAEELIYKGSDSDIASQRCALRRRAVQLTELGDIQRKIDKLGSAVIEFEPANIPTDAKDSLIGHIRWQDDDGNYMPIFLLGINYDGRTIALLTSY